MKDNLQSLHEWPMWLTFLMGAVILAFYRWWAALLYALYVAGSLLWFMYFICRYCGTSQVGHCESAIGHWSMALFPKRGKPQAFRRQFRRHIAVLFPDWFVPPIVGILVLVQRTFSLPLLILIIIFCLVAFVVLPVLSNRKSCATCTMKRLCPWAKNTPAVK